MNIDLSALTLCVVCLTAHRYEPVFDRPDRVAILCASRGCTAGIYTAGAIRPTAMIGADGVIRSTTGGLAPHARPAVGVEFAPTRVE